MTNLIFLKKCGENSHKITFESLADPSIYLSKNFLLKDS